MSIEHPIVKKPHPVGGYGNENGISLRPTLNRVSEARPSPESKRTSYHRHPKPLCL